MDGLLPSLRSKPCSLETPASSEIWQDCVAEDWATLDENPQYPWRWMQNV